MSIDLNILILGGAGYIGSHTNKFLIQRGYKTVVYDNLVRGHREFVKWGNFEFGDLSSKEQLRLCFKKYNILAVMHFGAFAYVGESVTDPGAYYMNNVANTLNVLDVMREFGVSNFIFSSSCATYGVPHCIPITEDHPQNPINPYGRSKLMVEHILNDYEKAYGLRYINLRYFNAAGADPDCEIGEWHEPETHLIPLILSAALGRTDSVNIYGNDYDTADGTCIRDYIHVADLADAHILALEYLLQNGKSDSFNLGNGKGFSVLEIVEAARRITARNINLIITERRPGDPPVLVGCPVKAVNILKWRPEFDSLDYILQSAWQWHKRGNVQSAR